MTSPQRAKSTVQKAASGSQESGSRWARFCDRHPILVFAGGVGVCVAFPFAYEALRAWVH